MDSCVLGVFVRFIANISCGRRGNAFITPDLLHFLFNNVFRHHAVEGQQQRTNLFSCLHVIVFFHSATLPHLALLMFPMLQIREYPIYFHVIFFTIITFCLCIFCYATKHIFACLDCLRNSKYLMKYYMYCGEHLSFLCWVQLEPAD